MAVWNHIAFTLTMIWMFGTGGMLYAFAIFAADLKIVENYDQKELNFVGSMAYANIMLQYPIGIIITWLGNKVVTTAGEIIRTTGYAAFFLTVYFAPQSNYLIGAIFFYIGMILIFHFIVTTYIIKEQE
jgi:hypothetical protein